MVNKNDIKIIIDNPVKAFTTFSSDKIAELLLYFNNKSRKNQFFLNWINH